MPDWKGPNILAQGLSYIWAAPQFQFLETLSNEKNYDWPAIKTVWYASARTNQEHFSVFLEKSPPNLARVKMLKKHFQNSKFIYMLRNPFCIAESIIRFAGEKYLNILEIAAAHIIACFEMQKNNLQSYPGLLVTYEDMCSNTHATQAKLKQFVPELSDLVLEQTVDVKQRYNEPLRNMNEDHLKRLSSEQKEKLLILFVEHEELFKFFGYSMKI